MDNRALQQLTRYTLDFWILLEAEVSTQMAYLLLKVCQFLRAIPFRLRLEMAKELLRKLGTVCLTAGAVPATKIFGRK
jgi:hypothetical protein